MTSATDNRTTELREKLTERGVKWWPMRNNGYYEDRDTEFVANGKKHTAHEWGDGLAVYNLTPEQAIAATLGSGTCEPKWTLQGETQTQEFWSCECGNCGECFGVETRESFPFKMTIDKVDIPNFCPNCGKAVKR